MMKTALEIFLCFASLGIAGFGSVCFVGFRRARS